MVVAGDRGRGGRKIQRKRRVEEEENGEEEVRRRKNKVSVSDVSASNGAVE